MDSATAAGAGADYVEALLGDASLVLAYATRAGIDLGERLSLARSKVGENPHQSAAADLSVLESALSKAVNDIAPITLLHLRSGKSPFAAEPVAPRWWKRLLAPQAVLFLLAAVTIGSIITRTDHLHEEQRVLKAMQELEEANFDEKFAAMERKIIGGVLRDPNSAEYAEFKHSYSALARLAEKKVSVNAAVSGLSQPPPDLYDKAAALWRRLFGTSAAPAYAQGAAPYSLSYVDKYKLPDPCDQSTIENQLKALNPIKDQSWIPLFVYLKDIDTCISSKLNFQGSSAGLPADLGLSQPNNYDDFAAREQQRVALYTAWILPMLYGSLGAIVFLMRNLQNVRTPSLSLLDTVFRIALGAISGIVIGWFFAPGDEAALVNATPFALAFVAGFSIELLFSLLDRINTSLKSAGSTAKGAAAG
jgi:hypothetical protein